MNVVATKLLLLFAVGFFPHCSRPNAAHHRGLQRHGELWAELVGAWLKQ
jgi:hypothetical protein